MQYEISNEVAAIFLFLLWLLLLLILFILFILFIRFCTVLNAIIIARLFSTIILFSLLRLYATPAHQTSYLLLDHCSELLKVLFRIPRTCRVHESVLCILNLSHPYLWIALIQLLGRFEHRSLAKILHLILATHHYLRLRSDQLRLHSLKGWQTIEHKCHIHNIQKLQHLQTDGSSNRKTHQHYLLATLGCILTHWVDCLCYFRMIETAEKLEVIALRLSIALVSEEAGYYDRLLVVSNVLYHEAQVVLKPKVFVESDYDAGWVLFDVNVGEHVLSDEGLPVFECLFWKLLLHYDNNAAS